MVGKLCNLCSGLSGSLYGSLGAVCGAQCELMIISAIIAVRNPDNCHPHLVRLHDRLWTCGAEMCPLTDMHAHTHTHTWYDTSHVHHCPIFQSAPNPPLHEFHFTLISLYTVQALPESVLLPINTEKKHILCVFSPSASSAG